MKTERAQRPLQGGFGGESLDAYFSRLHKTAMNMALLSVVVATAVAFAAIRLLAHSDGGLKAAVIALCGGLLWLCVHRVSKVETLRVIAKTLEGRELVYEDVADKVGLAPATALSSLEEMVGAGIVASSPGGYYELAPGMTFEALDGGPQQPSKWRPIAEQWQAEPDQPVHAVDDCGDSWLAHLSEDTLKISADNADPYNPPKLIAWQQLENPPEHLYSDNVVEFGGHGDSVDTTD